MRHLSSLLFCVVIHAFCIGSLQADVINEYAKLLPSDGAERDYFGRSVSISGDTMVAGVPRENSIRVNNLESDIGHLCICTHFVLGSV